MTCAFCTRLHERCLRNTVVEVNEETAPLGDTRPLEALSDRCMASFTIYDDEPVVHQVRHSRWTEVMINITYAAVSE